RVGVPGRAPLGPGAPHSLGKLPSLHPRLRESPRRPLSAAAQHPPPPCPFPILLSTPKTQSGLRMRDQSTHFGVPSSTRRAGTGSCGDFDEIIFPAADRAFFRA